MWRVDTGLVCAVLTAGAVCLPGFAQNSPRLFQLTDAQLWQRLEFGISNVPAVSNPFDPDRIRIDATFELPSGGSMVVPAFWTQDYQRSQVNGSESDAPVGAPGWRLRFAPPQTGSYSVWVLVRTNGQFAGASPNASFEVSAGPPPARFGYVGLAPGGRYFQTGDGRAMPLKGENVGWFDAGGTYDYDQWFGRMQNAGENYARIWMCPWAFGIEDTANSLTHYALLPAWQLDYVLQLAEQRGIYLLLCLDYHGMFASQPDPTWGGGNYWPTNPYNVTNGGPCGVANDFFTQPAAWAAYQKRLRYLIARYGYSQNLLAWEFFNEIDNDYAFLNAADVAAWHSVMGGWMRTNDPFHHLVTTSLTGGSDRPEIWTLPQLDFAAYHSYNEPSPASRLAALAQSFLQRYGKPVMIGEFGTDWRGWNRSNDPYLRGFRQGLWGGALGGSVGTAMSWWWENIDGENVYPLYTALGTVLDHTGWGRGTWSPVEFQTSGPPPTTVGNPTPGAAPVDVLLPLNAGWGVLTPGRLAVPGPEAAAYSAQALDSFVHGVWHADLKTPFILNAWLTNNARLVMHLNSVSDDSIMVVRVDGTELFRTNLPNLDGTYNVNEEYNLDIPVNLPPGHRSIEITNAGNDWFYLDWIRLEQVLPSSYSGDWAPFPEAIGMRGSHESLLYVVAPYVSFPANATNASLPTQQGKTILLTNWPAGNFIADWYRLDTGARIGSTQASTVGGVLTLPLPDFTADLAGILYPPPTLTPLGLSAAQGFQFRLDSETGGQYLIRRSPDFDTWSTLASLTNALGSTVLTDPAATASPRLYYRAEKSD
jgi:hypothetical protein